MPGIEWVIVETEVSVAAESSPVSSETESTEIESTETESTETESTETESTETEYKIETFGTEKEAFVQVKNNPSEITDPLGVKVSGTVETAERVKDEADNPGNERDEEIRIAEP